MTQFIAFNKSEQEEYEGHKMMTDPGVHEAVAAEVESRVGQCAKALDIGVRAGAFSLGLYRMGYDARAVDVDDIDLNIPEIRFRKVQVEESLSDVFSSEQFAEEAGFKLVLRRGIGHMPVLDWSNFRISNLLTALPRMVLNLMMKGPGPKDRNIRLYCFERTSDIHAANSHYENNESW